jgi:outer membrane receptor protein involved in Fe transport
MMTGLIRTLRRLGPVWLLVLAAPAFGQETSGAGSVFGQVREADTGVIITNVAVSIVGTPLRGVSGSDGRYSILMVPAGVYEIAFTRSDYERLVQREVRVVAGEATPLDVQLRLPMFELELLEIMADPLGGLDAGLMFERQQSSVVMDGLGAEAIARLSLSDAAGMVGKVTGASVVDGKFAVIRGLSDRYTAATLNGAEIPSADPYRKSAQLDLFPASLIERMVVAKTFTPDQPGSFTGGSVNIITKSFPERTFYKFSAGVSYNPQSNLNEDFLVAPEAEADLFSLGREVRGVPDRLRDFDSLRINGQQPRANDPARRIPNNASQAQVDAAFANADELAAFNQALGPAGFAGVTSTAPLNHDYDVEFGTTLTNAFSRRLGVFASANYGRSFDYFDEGINNRFFADGRPRFVGTERRGRMHTAYGGGANLAYEFSPEHEVKFNLLANQSVEDEARFVTGLAPEGDSQDPIVQHQLHYTERSVQAYQLSGRHEFPALAGNQAEWLGSYVITTQDEPDYRFFHGFLNAGGVHGFGGNNLPQPNLPSRTFRELEEKNLTLKLDDTQPFTWWRGLEGSFKTGVYVSETERAAYERTFSYVGDRGSDANGYVGSPNDYLRADNLGYGSRPQAGGARQLFFQRVPTDNFGNNRGDGNSTIYAGYGMLDAEVLSWLRLIGGLRYETTLLKVSGRAGGQEVSNTIDEGHLLPALGAVVQLRDDMNLRLHFAQTIARPSFREITPTRNYDVTTDDLFLGNPFLQISEVNNFDARWEWFRRPGEVLSAGVFYKDIQRPIELEYTDLQANISSFQNRSEAQLYGFELEARTRLDFLSDLLEPFSMGLNFAYIISEVPLTDTERQAKQQLDPGVESVRPLYDQSPYILNVDLSYELPRTGTVVTVAGNLTGERLFIANPLGPDVYEHPPVSLDVIVSQRLNQWLSLKFTARNLLNPDYKRTYGSSPDGPVYSSHQRGRQFGLSLAAEF